MNIFVQKYLRIVNNGGKIRYIKKDLWRIMLKKKSVFLLQDTKEMNDELCKSFFGDEQFEIIGMANDGTKGFSLLCEKKPDIVILSLVLPGLDGLGVISQIRQMNLPTKIIVLSALCREEIISRAMRDGANYFMTKPYNFSVLRQRLIELDVKEEEESLSSNVVVNRQRTSLDEKISKIFINVGIPPHIKGYSFLREGVKMAVNEPEIINNITKKLYPMIGEKYSTTASKVERAIRHAIEVAWNRGRIESINTILGVRAYVGAEKPTNGEFIALVADKMLLENV